MDTVTLFCLAGIVVPAVLFIIIFRVLTSVRPGDDEPAGVSWSSPSFRDEPSYNERYDH